MIPCSSGLAKGYDRADLEFTRMDKCGHAWARNFRLSITGAFSALQTNFKRHKDDPTRFIFENWP